MKKINENRGNDEISSGDLDGAQGGGVGKIAIADLFLACTISRRNRLRPAASSDQNNRSGHGEEPSATRNYAANRQTISVEHCAIPPRGKRWTAIFQELSAVDKRHEIIT